MIVMKRRWSRKSALSPDDAALDRIIRRSISEIDVKIDDIVSGWLETRAKRLETRARGRAVCGGG